MIKPADLYTPAYIRTQKALHATPRGYGGKGAKWADIVEALARELGAWSILDYGCGQATLGTALRLRGWSARDYDPAIPGKDQPPVFADLVVSTDVLEHIEPDKLDAVLAHLKLLARKAVFVVISTRPANKWLSDGRNAHLIVEDAAWWAARLQAAGFVVTPGPARPGLKSAREFTAVLTW